MPITFVCKQLPPIWWRYPQVAAVDGRKMSSLHGLLQSCRKGSTTVVFLMPYRMICIFGYFPNLPFFFYSLSNDSIFVSGFLLKILHMSRLSILLSSIIIQNRFRKTKLNFYVGFFSCEELCHYFPPLKIWKKGSSET